MSRDITMVVTASSGGTEYTEGEQYSLPNVLAESFATHGYATFNDPEEQEAFNARFEDGLITGRIAGVVQKRDADAATAVDEGGVG